MTNEEMTNKLLRISDGKGNLRLGVASIVAMTLLNSATYAQDAVQTLSDGFPKDKEIAEIVAVLRKRYGL